jgi:hypothetical protein
VKTEQPTLPLPIPGTENLPPRHSDFKESGLWLFPGAPVAAFLVGEPIRQFLIVTDEARSNFALICLVVLFAGSLVVFLRARTVGRGKDGRS